MYWVKLCTHLQQSCDNVCFTASSRGSSLTVTNDSAVPLLSPRAVLQSHTILLCAKFISIHSGCLITWRVEIWSFPQDRSAWTVELCVIVWWTIMLSPSSLVRSVVLHSVHDMGCNSVISRNIYSTCKLFGLSSGDFFEPQSSGWRRKVVFIDCNWKGTYVCWVC